MTKPASSASTARFPSDVLSSLTASCGIIGKRATQIITQFRAETPASDESSEREQLLRLVGMCAYGTRPVAYLSVPITTGRAYLQNHRHATNSAGAKADSASRPDTSARAMNKRLADAAADRLRAKLHGVVINPSDLIDVPGWRQADYHAFWTAVIARFPEEVLFLDGWQYSVGCAIEFSTALQVGLPTFTEHMAPLDAEEATTLLRDAVAEYENHRLNPQPLRDSLGAVESAASVAYSRQEAR
jgi:hypothetical protein